MTTTPVAPAPISEVQAARTIGVHRATLQLWRKKGLLNPAAFAASPRIAPPGITSRINYDREFFESIARGERDGDELFATGTGDAA